MSALLAQNWWAVALRGAFAVLFGILTFLNPGATIVTLVIFFAVYVLVDGVFAIISGVRAAQAHQRWGLLILEGVANILAGVVALAFPALAVVVSVLLVVYLIAIWSVVSGVLMAVAAFKLNLEHGRWWLVLAGAFSVVFGVLLAISPAAGAYVLTIWLGAYALVFGAMLIAVALKLRQRAQSGAAGFAPAAAPFNRPAMPPASPPPSTPMATPSPTGPTVSPPPAGPMPPSTPTT